ncbi:hypothetical protein BSKO_03284 [Bryopsis sp. KO-2023]|nr:hypothetical protein BSKO_03284 [Bryopsis sp. KO-2023]
MTKGTNAVVVSMFLVLLVCAATVSAGKKGGYDPVVYVRHAKKTYVAPATTKKGGVILYPAPKKVVVVSGKKG